MHAVGRAMSEEKRGRVGSFNLKLHRETDESRLQRHGEREGNAEIGLAGGWSQVLML